MLTISYRKGGRMVHTNDLVSEKESSSYNNYLILGKGGGRLYTNDLVSEKGRADHMLTTSFGMGRKGGPYANYLISENGRVVLMLTAMSRRG